MRTRETPEPASFPVAAIGTLPSSLSPESSMSAEGRVLSTCTETLSDTAELPNPSVVTTRRSYAPSPTSVVSHVTLQGDRVTLPMGSQLPAPAAETSNETDATPEP